METADIYIYIYIYTHTQEVVYEYRLLVYTVMSIYIKKQVMIARPVYFMNKVI